MEDVKKYLEDAEEKMEFAALHLEEALSRIRAGRANVHILDEIRVDSYGSMVPLSNVASLNTPDARSITIKPWEKQAPNWLQRRWPASLGRKDDYGKRFPNRPRQ